MAEKEKKQKHIHQFKRHQYKNGEAVFFCILNCRFKVHVKLSLGKISLCNKCLQPFEMNEYSMRLAKPKCEHCRQSDKVKAPEVTLDDLNIELPAPSETKPKDPLADLKSRMKLLRNEKTPESPPPNSVSDSEIEIEVDGKDDLI